MSKNITLSEEDKKTIEKLQQIGHEYAKEIIEAYQDIRKNTKIKLKKK